MNDKLAKLFSKILIEELGEEKMRETIARNKATNNVMICHSHDFCDANMVMLEAWCKLNPPNTVDGECDGFFVDDTYDLVNIAWHEAKANNFYVKNDG